MANYYFDIETTGLNPFGHKVLTIQLKKEDDITIWKLWDYENEIELVNDFMKYLRSINRSDSIYGYNSLKFDLPFLSFRLAIHSAIDACKYQDFYERLKTFPERSTKIDELIASCSRKIAATCQLLKETGMRIGEACRLKWIDLDNEHNVITLNAPEKGGQPRMLKISVTLVAMLNALPKETEKIFGTMRPRAAASNFYKMRKRVAFKLQNPRINSIHLHTFRHWYATMEYHKTKDILHVMKRLGHKRIENTLIYTQLVQFESDQYHSAVAENTDEARKLIETGFEYVCTHQNLMLFRKRK